jgi:hypothetical protein
MDIDHSQAGYFATLDRVTADSYWLPARNCAPIPGCSAMGRAVASELSDCRLVHRLQPRRFRRSTHPAAVDRRSESGAMKCPFH